MLVRSTNLSQKSFEYPKDWGQGSRGCFAGGGAGSYNQYGFTTSSTAGMTYVTISTPSNSTNFGTLGVQQMWKCAGTSGRGRGLISGGSSGTMHGAAASTNHVAIRYVTIATLSNASSFGDLRIARNDHEAVSNGTKALIIGGAADYNNQSNELSTIDYVTIATPSTSLLFGNIGTTQGTCWIMQQGTGDGNYGMWKLNGSGGYSSDKYEYLAINTPGNSSAFGGVSQTGEGTTAASNGSRAFWSGGYNGGDPVTIDYLTWSTPSNATQYGNLRINYYNDRSCDDGSKTVIGGGGHTQMDTFSMDLAAGTAVISSLFGHLTGTNYEGSGDCAGQNTSDCRRNESAAFAG